MTRAQAYQREPLMKPPAPLHLLQVVGTPADAPLHGAGGGGFALIRPQLTSLTGRLHQGCSHTVETRLGVHFQFHIPD